MHNTWFTEPPRNRNQFKWVGIARNQPLLAMASSVRRVTNCLLQSVIRYSQLAQSQTQYHRVDQHANPRHAAGRARTQGSLTKHRTFESFTLALVGGRCVRYAHMKLLPAPPTRLAAKIRRLSQNARNKYVNASVLATGYLALQRILASRLFLEVKSLMCKYKSGTDAVSAFESYYTLFKNATHIKQNIVCRVPAVHYKI